MRPQKRRLVRSSCLCLLSLLAGPPPAVAACQEFGGFAIFQCAYLAYFEPPPFPVTFDPNTGQPENVTAVFWQIGFGNRNMNTGAGTDGTGTSSPAEFNGNDSGLFPVDLMDAHALDASIPSGALCLRVDNWGNAGVDGCCDNPRDPLQPIANDDILNPYYDVYDYRYGGPYYLATYSLEWQQDYPMAVLLIGPSGHDFAIAAVASNDRGNTGTGENGPCHWSHPGSNPAPCDHRPGFYDFAAISNGRTNPVTGLLNVVPWQSVEIAIDGIDPIDPDDPGVGLSVDASWNAVAMQSDESTRPSTNPGMGGSGFASGVGVQDIDAIFPLIHYALEVAPVSDPSFSSPSSTLEFLDSSVTDLEVPPGSCLRLKVIFGKAPQTAVAEPVDCRVGRCGDVGYEVMTDRICPTGPCTPSPEICDGLDNDCDGVIDEGNLGSGAPCDTGQPGLCADGVETCENGAIICAPLSTPEPESCDNLDNDCDGVVDDFASTCGLGECASAGFCAAGTDTCVPGQPEPESCDNLDNDCDGVIDDFRTQCGVGDCAMPGRCLGGVDNCVPGLPSPELCNGHDDDCDGQTDEEDPDVGRACDTGLPGVCTPGTLTCLPRQYLTCVPDQPPSPESCDNLDNDCDGQIDEGNPDGGGLCDTGLGGLCAAGALLCDSGQLICVATGGTPCDTGLPGFCSEGAIDCSTGQPVCIPLAASNYETCNGVDDDCDGSVDEEVPGTGTACQTGHPGVCGRGSLECLPSGVLWCVQTVFPSPEICDGLDNDCDGRTDEASICCSDGDIDLDEFCDGVDNCPAAYNPSQDDFDGDGVGDACEVTITRPLAGGAVDCTSAARTELFRARGPYSRFRFAVSWLPDFSRVVGSGSLSRGFWKPGPGQWRRACERADRYLYIQAFGEDRGLRGNEPARIAASDVIMVRVNR